MVSLPLLEALTEIFPDSEITFIASNRGKDALIGCKFLKNSYSADLNDKNDFNRLLEILRNEKFNLSLNLSEKLPCYALPLRAGIPVRVGFDPGTTQPFKSLLCRFFLTVRAEYKNDPSRSLKLHEVERQFLLLNALGFYPEPKSYSVAIDKRALSHIEKLLPENRLLGVHISNKWFLNGWSELFFKNMAQALIDSFPDYSVFFTCGSQEREIAERMGFKRCLGDLSFSQWAAAISKARALITMDTSASHLAAGLSIPAAVVFEEKYFEHTSDRWKPWKTPSMLIKRPSLASLSKKEVGEAEERLINDIAQAVKKII